MSSRLDSLFEEDVQMQDEHKCVETMWEVEDFYKYQAVKEVVK